MQNNITQVNKLVNKNETRLFILLAALATCLWLIFFIATFGMLLIYLFIGWLFSLFAHSYLIANIKGNGIKVTANQFPDLHEKFTKSCEAFGLNKQPEFYIYNGNGVLNAFATKFLGKNYVVILSSVLDSIANTPHAIDFYIGHELGHVSRKHLLKSAFLMPVLWLPILGAAYHRACEYTCDQFGKAACTSTQAAIEGLTLLAAGESHYQKINGQAYFHQLNDTSGFWVSFNEIIADYPWLVKRVAAVENNQKHTKRNPLAYLFALLVPRTGLGGGVLVTIMIIGILAAIAVPAYQDYLKRAQQTQTEQPKKTDEQSLQDLLKQLNQASQAAQTEMPSHSDASAIADTATDINSDDSH